jgi:hypothetical protein
MLLQHSAIPECLPPAANRPQRGLAPRPRAGATPLPRLTSVKDRLTFGP